MDHLGFLPLLISTLMVACPAADLDQDLEGQIVVLVFVNNNPQLLKMSC